MGVIRNCLTMIGLFCVLVVGGCMASVRGCTRTYNPTVWSERVDETPDKTRRMLSDFLQTATFEPDAQMIVAGKPTRAAVQDFTDGSIHLTLDGGGKRLVEVVARVVDADGDARVEVVSDAAALAELAGGDAPPLHRYIHAEIEDALQAIDQQRPLPGGFSMARLIKVANDDAG